MMHPRSVCFYAAQILTLALALTPRPSQADEYADVAQLLRSHKPDAALVQAERFLLTRPADPQMRFLKGVIQGQLGQPALAIDIFAKLTEDYPELSEPYNNLAVLYASQGQYDKARVALEMAIRTNPGYAAAQHNLGDVYVRLASQTYGAALALDASNPALPKKLALTLDILKPAPIEPH